MARPLKYTARRQLTLTPETDEKLIKISKKNEVGPAVQARIYVERGIDQDETVRRMNAKR